MDVGCANVSLARIRRMLTLCQYTGDDVFPGGSYVNGENEEFIIAEPKKFGTAIAGMGRRFEAVISRHNPKHCNDRDKTLSAMLGSVVKGGQL